jgi:hypothetical protein
MTKKHIFLLTDGPLSPQAQVEALADRLEADVRAALRQHLKQRAHIDEIKRLCHISTQPRGT